MRLLPLCLAVLAGGCLSPAPAPAVRWFAPHMTPVAAVDGVRPVPLRRIAVRADAHLDERMLLRTSDVEFFPDELHRWIASPAQFTEQALESSLFDSGRCVEDPGGPELRATLHGFEAVLGRSPLARIEIEVAIEHEGAARRTVVRREVGLTDTAPESIARGIGAALAASADAVAAWLVQSGG